jgi:hypothetical protein
MRAARLHGNIIVTTSPYFDVDVLVGYWVSDELLET